MTDMISLADAARRLSMSWDRTWRALLSGKLEGEKRGGRWYVTVQSVRLNEGSFADPNVDSEATPPRDDKCVEGAPQARPRRPTMVREVNWGEG